MKRRALAGFVLGAAALLASSLVPLPASVQAQGSTPSGGHEVEVRARRLASGNVELGLRETNPADGSVSYPTLDDRFFLYDDSGTVVGKWYYSEPVSVGVGAGSVLVEVMARRLASGNVEFGLRLFGKTAWVPKARYFIYGSARPGGPWMYSSVFTTETQSDLYSVGSICASGTPVPDPAKNPGLVSDCIALLAAKKTLSQMEWELYYTPNTAYFYNNYYGVNWSGSTEMTAASWSGNGWNGLFEISGTPKRVKDMRIYYIESEIPVEFTELDGLTYLYLSFNAFHGTPASGLIPEGIGRLSNLEFLHFTGVSAGGGANGTLPPSICNLRSATAIKLESLSLRGSIPSCMGSVSTLQNLDLRINSFSGSIPASLGRLSNLEELHLFNNSFGGEIPAELGSLTNLRILDLQNNNLTGEIPVELGNLTKLSRLSLQGTNLTGCVPASLKTYTSGTEELNITIDVPTSLKDNGAVRWCT